MGSLAAFGPHTGELFPKGQKVLHHSSSPQCLQGLRHIRSKNIFAKEFCRKNIILMWFRIIFSEFKTLSDLNRAKLALKVLPGPPAAHTHICQLFEKELRSGLHAPLVTND